MTVRVAEWTQYVNAFLHCVEILVEDHEFPAFGGVGAALDEPMVFAN